MPVYEITAPNGKTYEIEGPAGASQQQVIRAVLTQHPDAGEPPKPKEQAGFVSSFLESAKTLGAAPAASRFATAKTPEEQEEARKKLIEAQESERAKTGFTDINSLASAIDWAKQTAGQSAGALAAPGLVAGAGKLLTKAPGVAKALGYGTLGAQYLIENLGRQAGEQQEAVQAGATPETTSVGKATLGAAGQTALDVVGMKFFSPVFSKFPVVGALFGKEGEQTAKETAEGFAKALQQGKLSRKGAIVKGVVGGTAFEIPQEIAQSMLERWQAGLSLTDEDARHEYLEAAAGAVLLGSALGAPAGFMKNQAKRNQAQQIIDAREAEKAAAARRVEEEKKAAEPAPTEAAPAETQQAAAPVDLTGSFQKAPEAGVEDIDVGLQQGQNIAEQVIKGAKDVTGTESEVATKPDQRTDTVGADVSVQGRTPGGESTVAPAGAGVETTVQDVTKPTVGKGGVSAALNFRDWVESKGIDFKTIKADYGSLTVEGKALRDQYIEEVRGGTLPTPAEIKPVEVTAPEPTEIVEEPSEAEIAAATEKPAEVVTPKPKKKQAGVDTRGYGEAAASTIIDIADSTRKIKNDMSGVAPLNPETLKAHVDYLVDTAEGVTGPSETSEKKVAKEALTNLDLTNEEIAASKKRLEKTKQRIKELSSDQAEMQRLENRSNKLELQKKKLEDERVEALEAGEDTTSLENEISNISADIADAQRQLLDFREINLKKKKEKVLKSPARGKGAGLNLEKVQAIVDRIKANWKGAPNIRVVESVEDLPNNLQDFINAHPNTPGLFDPRTKQIYIIADNLATESGVAYTVTHEAVGHYGLREVLGDRYDAVMNAAYMNPSIKAAADAYMKANPEVSKQEAVEEVIAERAETAYDTDSAIRNIVDRISNAIRAFIRKISGGKIYSDISDAEIRGIISASRNLIETGRGASASGVSVEGAAPALRSPARATRIVPQLKPATPEDVIKANLDRLDSRFNKAGGMAKALKFLWSREGNEWLTVKFQNDRAPLKNLQRRMELTGQLFTSGPKANDIYNEITLSSGKAFHAMTQHLDPLMKRMDKQVEEYAKKNNLSTNEALAKLDAYFTALHEPERRHIKWLLNVPLDNTNSLKLGNESMTAADWRKKILDTMSSSNKFTDDQVKNARRLLEELAKNHASELGSSPLGYKGTGSTKEDSSLYRVIGDREFSVWENLRKDYDKDPNKALVDDIIDTMKNLQKEQIALDKESNYWSQPVSNIVKLYDFKHYVPFKGKPESQVSKNDDRLDPQAYVGKDFAANIAAQFEGRESESENTLLQVRSDAVRSALRYGRKDVTGRIKNAIEQGWVNGKTADTKQKAKVITFQDRYNNQAFDPSSLSGDNKVFHYLPNGTIEIIEVNDKNIRQAIRRMYVPPAPFLKAVNTATSLIAQQHTRYNPAFAPMNFVRDALTNAFTLGAEMGPAEAGKFLWDVSARSTSLITAGNVARLYNQGKIKEIEALAKTNPRVKDILDYLQAGGRVTYIQGIAVEGQMEELIKSLGKNKILRSKEQFDKIVDVWTDAFELTSRAAAFSVAKQNYLSKIKNPTSADIADASRQAVAYSKNLANFEQVGEWGRAMGAMFMFFRPAATGAVRALDALTPAFQNVDTLINALPQSVRDNPVAVKKLKEDFAKQKKSAQHMVAGLIGAGVTVYLMAMMAADDDELGRNKVATDDMARWTRYARLPVGFITGKENDFVQVPWGFGLGSFAAFGAQMAALASGNSSAGDALGNTFQIALDSFIPIPVSRVSPTEKPLEFVVDSLTPSLGRPFVEYAMNTDSLGREIYNNRNTKLGNAYTGGDNIPELYKDATRLLANSTNGALDIGPNTLYFFANNYIDSVSRISHNTYNLGQTITGDKNFDPKTDLMVLDSFFGKKSNFDAREFSSVEKQIQKKAGLLSMFEKSNPEQFAKYVEAHPYDPAIVEIYNKQLATLNKAREQANIIRRMPGLTPKQRKETLEDMTLTQNIIKRSMIDTFKQFDVQP